MKIKNLRAEFVKHVPEKLAEGVLYISEEFETAGHLCCCGCGEEIFTPLNSAQWRLTKNARSGTVSLYPSIGNWKYACQSHYWIKNNSVVEAGPMSDHVINAVIKRDRRDKHRFFEAHNQTRTAPSTISPQEKPQPSRFFARFIKWVSGL